MEGKMEQDVLRKLKRRRHQRLWQKAVSMMMCVVVFCTTYALILPAITKEADTFCGLEAHTHTIDCYPQQGELICEFAQTELHVHTEDCHPTTEELPTCGLEEAEAHTHTDACTPVEEKTLCCTLEEGPGHTHSEACVSLSEKTLVCGNEETQGHTHTDACSVLETVLTCTLTETEEHTHGDGCYTEIASNVCGMEEVAAHTHTDACYTAATAEYICGLEEAEAHTHTDECYQITTTYGCGLEEIEAHVHEEACYPIVYECEQDAADHIHTEECYASAPELICTLEENDEHTHGADCYIGTMTCEREEHVHTLECYSDPDADLEVSSYWESTLPGLTGNPAEDLVAVAESQLGYTESTRNYIVEGTDDIKGYTRYGAWYGIPYDDWNAMFVSFCLHYANADGMPLESSCSNWVYQLQSAGMYASAADHTPKAGDLVFFDWNGDGGADHVGIVSRYFPEGNGAARLQCIEGDRKNTVCKTEYNQMDPDILGYGVLPEAQPPVTEAPEEETQSEERIGPEDTDAWAVLVDPADQPAEETVSPFSLRKMSISTWAMPRASEPLDLTPYINAVTMYDMDGNILPSGSVVTEGDMIEFRIEYTVTGQQLGVMNGETVTVTTDTLNYDLPEIFEIVKSDEGSILNSAGQAVGSYLIDSESGTITMNFTRSYVEQNAKGIQIHGYISFFSTVVKITENENENQHYEFTDKIILGITVKENIEAVGDLTIEKKKLSVDGEELVYEVTVTSAEGTMGTITIQDQMSAGLTFKEGISVKDGKGANVNNVKFNAAADGKSFELVLPEMAAGDTYTVQYRCTADVDLLDADMTVRNTASVTGKDSQNNELKDSTTVTHTFTMLEKTGQQNEDGSISWTITINQAKLDISGWTLEDIITTSEGSSSYTGPVTISDANGNVLAQNVKLPYKFPDGSKDTYVITYTTSHGYGAGDSVSNKAILKDHDTEINDFSGVAIGSPIEKSGKVGTVIQDENGKYLLPITWTVTIDTSNGEIPAGKVLHDSMEDWNNNDMYMTYAQLQSAYANIVAALEGAGSSVSEFKAMEFKAGMGHNSDAINFNSLDSSKLYDYFEVTLGTAIPKGKTVTFTYEAYGEFENNILAGSLYTNQIDISGQYNVKSTVSYTGGTVKAKKMAMSYYNPEEHTSDWFWNLYHYNGTDSVTELEYEKLKDDYLAWAIELSVPPDFAGEGDIILYEDLPSGVTIRGLTLPFQSNVPRVDLEQWNMECEQTYAWSFELYTAEQYYKWDFRNGEQVSITIEVSKDGDLKITIPSKIFRVMAEYAKLTDQPEGYGYLHVFTQINDSFEWTPKSEGSQVYVHNFENRFTIEDDNGNVLDFGSQTQKITKDESKGIIRKQATTDDSNVIAYSVVLNAYGKDLIENSNALEIHDELTYTSTDSDPVRLRLVPGSVKLYEIKLKSDGSYEKLKEGTINYSYNESSVANNGTTVWTHTIDLTVPDSRSLLLEYNYIASGSKGATQNVFNTCTISGVGDGELSGDSKLEIDVKEASAQADMKGVLLYKVDSNSDGIFLENAKFNIYIWNEAQGKYIIVHDLQSGKTEFATNAAGMIVLDSTTMDQFAYNTAYYIVEVESPNGYFLSPEPYYFQIVNSDMEKYPSSLPANFTGHKLTSGDIIYRQNTSDKTEITVEKYWQDYSGETITVTGETVTSVTLELWQMLQGDPGSAKRYGTYTMTPDANGNWNLTITDLPKATENVNGTKGTNYLYYIKEVGVNGFDLESSENNDGINSGTIKLVNRKQEGYVLPKTGGAGTNLYTMAGLLLMLTSAAYLMYSNHPRRREEL